MSSTEKVKKVKKVKEVVVEAEPAAEGAEAEVTDAPVEEKVVKKKKKKVVVEAEAEAEAAAEEQAPAEEVVEKKKKVVKKKKAAAAEAAAEEEPAAAAAAAEEGSMAAFGGLPRTLTSDECTALAARVVSMGLTPKMMASIISVPLADYKQLLAGTKPLIQEQMDLFTEALQLTPAPAPAPVPESKAKSSPKPADNEEEEEEWKPKPKKTSTVTAAAAAKAALLKKDPRFADEDSAPLRPAAGLAPKKVKKSWEDEDKEEEAPKPTAPPKAKALTKAKLAAKEAQEKKDAEDRARAEEEELKANPDLMHAKKMAEKKAVEDADMNNAADLFSGVPTLSTAEIKASLPAAPGGPVVPDFAMKTDADWDAFSEHVAKKVGITDTRRLLKFLTTVLKKGTDRMKQEDVMQLRQTITVIIQDKQKADANKKKKSSGKVKLNMSEESSVDTRSGGGFTDNASDYDFL